MNYSRQPLPPFRVHAGGGNESCRCDYLADLKPIIEQRVRKWVRRGSVPREITFSEGAFAHQFEEEARVAHGSGALRRVEAVGISRRKLACEFVTRWNPGTIRTARDETFLLSFAKTYASEGCTARCNKLRCFRHAGFGTTKGLSQIVTPDVLLYVIAADITKRAFYRAATMAGKSP
jgi:hypothetical protein